MFHPLNLEISKKMGLIFFHALQHIQSSLKKKIGSNDSFNEIIEKFLVPKKIFYIFITVL